MTFDYSTLATLREHHPAWRLLTSLHAPLLASFLYKAFIESNKREILEADLTGDMEDALFKLREQGKDYPNPAADYLNDWCATGKHWLRKFYTMRRSICRAVTELI